MPLYSVSVTSWPAFGKLPAMREAVTAMVRDRQAAGARMNVLQSVVSADGPYLQTVTLYASLADLDAAILVPLPAPFFEAMAPAIASGPFSELREVVLEAPPIPQGGAPQAFIHRTRFTPAPGCGPALRDRFVERVNVLNAAGDRGALSVSLSGRSDLIWTRWFESMAHWEAVRTKGLADPKTRPFVEGNKDLLQETPSTQLVRIVVPMA